MSKEKQTNIVWWKEALRLQKIVAALLLVCFTSGLVHSDIDLDGIPDREDPFPETPVEAPVIFTPYENEIIYSPNREVTISGTGEVGSRVQLYDDGNPVELSCQETNGGEITGTGFAIASTTGGGSVDENALLTAGTVVDQLFYNTNNDSEPNTWIDNVTASWATEVRDDEIDGICDYEAGSEPEDRCGEISFPDQVIIMATSSRVFIFDAQARTFWKSIAVSDITSLAAGNGKILVGTSTGVQVLDFANDDFTQFYVLGAVTAVDTVAVGTTQYIAASTDTGAVVINGATGDIFSSDLNTPSIGVSITTSNRILWSTETEVYISNDAVDLITADSWASTDITSKVVFPYDTPGTVTVVEGDVIGLTTGVARVFDDGNGNILVQHVTTDAATLPMGLETRGQWLETTGTEAFDVSAADLTLNNIGNVPSAQVETEADTTMFNFGGVDGYLESKNNTDFSVTGKHLTVGAWIRRPDFGGSGPFEKVITHGEAGTAGEWDYWLSAGESFFDYGLEADPYYFGVTTVEGEAAASAFTFAIDKWQLLVGTYNGEEGTLRMYLDGVEQDQDIFSLGVNPVELSGDIATTDKMFRVGWGYEDEYFTGDVAMPFVSAETYSTEQVELLHRYSNGWFAEDIKTTLRGTSNTVTDVSCDKFHQECYVLTDDGMVTRIDGNLFAGGVTEPVVGLTDVSQITPTYLGTWECTHVFETSGAYSVTARTYWGNIPTAIQSEPRNFTIFSLAEQKLETPNILAFPSDYVGEKAATVMWTTDELEADYFVAEISTDVDFLTGVREQVVQGNAAKFIALDDNQQYFFRVKAENHEGAASDWSEIVTVIVDASAPEAGEVENLIGDITTETNIEFAWESTPFSDIGSGILWYEVEISTDQSFADDSQVVFTNDRYSFTSVGVTGETGKTYYARVRAMDAVGHWSDWASAAGTLVDTERPAEFTLTAEEQTSGPALGLNWTAAVDAETGIDSYDIWQKNGEAEAVLIATVSPSTHFYKVDSLIADGDYTFQVIAKNTAGLTVASNAVTTTVNTSYVGAPQIIAPHYTNTGTFDLEWVDNNFDPTVDQFVILRNGVEIATLASTESTYTDTFAFNDGEVYIYQVRADSSVTPLTGGESAEHKMLADYTAATADTLVISATPVNGWYNQNFSVLQTGTDVGTLFDPATSTGTGFGSGVDGVMVEVDAAFTPHNLPIQITTNGDTNSLTFRITDRASNVNDVPEYTDLNLDKVAPVVDLNQTLLSPSDFEAANGNVSTNTIPYEIIATDEFSGVDTYELSYRLDLRGDGFFQTEDGDLEWTDWQTVSATDSLAITEDGRYELRARVTDLAGNSTVSNTFFINIDQTAPLVSADYSMDLVTTPTKVTLEASDVSGAESGFTTMYYTTDGSDPKTSLFPVRREGTNVMLDPLADTISGVFTIKYYAVDAAGNESEVAIATNDATADADNDDMPDWWEAIYGGDLEAALDADSDGLTNLEEYANNTNPTVADSDADGESDLAEVTIGSDPRNPADHRFQWVTPNEGVTTGDKFTIMGTMTPGAIAEVIDVTNSTILGLMRADPQGRIAMELDLADGAHQLMVQFQNPKNPLAVITGETRDITVDAASVQPNITNLSDGDQVGPSMTRVLVENLTPNAEAELFEIVDGVVISLGRGDTDASGKADIWLPRRSESRRIFVMDLVTRATTEIVAFEQGVFIQGQVLDSANEPIEGALIELTNSQGVTITTQSAADGTYTIFSRVNQTHDIKFSKDGYVAHAQEVTVAYEDVYLTIILYKEAEAQAPRKGWSGREIDKKADYIFDYWVPTMTYEESMEQVVRLNAGIAGQVRKEARDGEEYFAGYIPGRIAVGQYYRPDDQKIFRITSYTDHVQQSQAESEIAYCLGYSDTVMDFSDVPTKSRWYPTVAKMHSLGEMKLDADKNFRPTEELTWDELLEMTFSVECREPDTYALLRTFDLEQFEGFPLRNSIESRRIYTALDEGWISLDTDLSQSPTREEILRLWMNSFVVPIDDESTLTSFTDVDEELAPVVVAARKFDLIPDATTFRGDSPLLRQEAAQWFVSFYDAEQDDLIDRSGPLNQFDDMKRFVSYEATKEAQARGALLQKEIAQERIARIMENAPTLSDEELAGNSGFVIRKGESRDEFRERLAIAKEKVEEDRQKLLAEMDYDKLREESLDRRIEERVVAESKIQITDKSGFIRRANETREDFLVRLDAAKQALEEKKVAVEATSVEVMRTSAPKVVAGPTRATQDAGRIKIDLEEDKTCRVKMNWETSAEFRERCYEQTAEEIEAKKKAYKKSFDLFSKREGYYEEQQQTVEPAEVTITAPSQTDSESIFERRRLDVALRRSPMETTETASSRIKTRR